MEYNGVLFGNGMTLNVLSQIKDDIPKDKRYLLNIDDFLKGWIENKITEHEVRVLYSALYGNDKSKWSFFDILKEETKSYYKKYNADIEYVMGKLLFQESEYKDVITFFPIMYNVWYIILSDYLYYLNLWSKVDCFYEDVVKKTGHPLYLWTTNFDLFAEKVNPMHIHGKFLQKIKNYNDIVFKMFNENKNYYYKYIWGHNGMGKLGIIREIMKYHDYKKYFDFDFFFNNNIRMKKLLIYGMGFRKSGYVSELKKKFHRYEQPAFGAIIDEHILDRIRVMLEAGMIEEIYITYFGEKEKSHLQAVMNEIGINTFELIRCEEFEFKV